jgi:hypothetical protein
MAEPTSPRPGPTPGPSTGLARSYARCFATPDGARVLADLEAQTLGRVLGPSADAAALRHLEGQRALVMRVRALIARGRAGD